MQKNYKTWNSFDSKFVSLLILISCVFVVSVATFFPSEPAIYQTIKSRGECERQVPLKGLTRDICDHREFSNSAWGDSIEYFDIAMGGPSYAPYSLRPIFPMAIGYIAKKTINENLANNKNYLFSHISFLSRVINFICVLLLCSVPLFYYLNFFKQYPEKVILLVLLNSITVGVVQTVPFFMLDIMSYVIFTFAACAFFRKNLIQLVIFAAIGVLIKEISIILFIPSLYLWLFSGNKLRNLLLLFLPIFVFVGIRFLLNEDLLSMQYGWKISKGEFSLGYFMSHLGSLPDAIIFFSKVIGALGFPILVASYIFRKYDREFLLFFTIISMSILVVLADALLAGRVPRVVSVSIPFFVVYSLHVLWILISESKNRDLKSLVSPLS